MIASEHPSQPRKGLLTCNRCDGAYRHAKRLESYYETGYSGYFSFDLIAPLLERHSGMKYADFIHEIIFKPLGLKILHISPQPNNGKVFLIKNPEACASGFFIEFDMRL